MRKKFVRVMLFCALSLVAGASFVGCKDYDDDIKNLQDQIDGKVTPAQLQEKVSAMETALNDAKSEVAAAKAAAEAAKTAAADALAKAEAANDDAAAAIAKADAAKAEVAVAAAEAKAAAIKAAEDKVAAMKPEIEKMVTNALAGKADKEALDNLALRVLKLENEVGAIIGHRLSSIAFVPETNINGIPAIKFYSLNYVEQKFNASHAAGASTTTDFGAAVTLDSKETVVRYRLNPRMGVRVQDIKLPSFDCIVSTNEIETRAVDPTKAGVNTPIKPIGGMKIDGNGILELNVAKSVDSNIDKEWLKSSDTEKFYMASLNVPIAETNWLEGETAANAPTVHSEYVRIAESTVTPMLKQTGSLTVTDHALNGVDNEGRYIHYHDSVSLYQSAITALVDHKVKWNEKFDLKKLTEVCIKEEDHKTLKNYKSYGLSFRYAVATGKYTQGTNLTDQQQFATIDNPTNGILTSKVYSIDGVTQTALGREPIVCAMLVDTVHHKLVAQRYIKLQFVKDITPPTVLPEYAFKNDTVDCNHLVNIFGTQEMNELIYRKVNATSEGNVGMSKNEFHTIYTGMEIVGLTKDGADIFKDPLTFTTNANERAIKDVAFVLIPDALDNTSYNLKWSMSPKAVGKIDLKKKNSVYIIKVAHKDPTGLHGDVTKTYKLTVDIPAQAFKYQGTYWQAGQAGKVFNVNPIVFNDKDHTTSGSGFTVNDFSHIEADLINGYLYGETPQKPANLAQLISYIRSCAEVRVEFDDSKFANYEHLKGYTVNDTKDALWDGAAGELNAKNGYVQADENAATIENNFGATVVENKKNLPWNFDETLGTTQNEATSVIRLSEQTGKKLGTPAAVKLIDKKVPVRLVVEYNSFNVVPVQEFEVFFIDPLAIDAKIGDKVQDATVGGSYVNVKEGLTYTDWNGYAVAESNFTSPTDKQKYATKLWAYYCVGDVVFDVAKATTNLAWENNVYVPKDDIFNGTLPTGRSLKQMKKDYSDYVEVPKNPTYLGYFNNNGTPVNLDYKIFMTVKATYKWGDLTKKQLELGVIRADGTPSAK